MQPLATVTAAVSALSIGDDEMSILENLGHAMGSLRYARDVLESKGQVMTRPWWPINRNTWTSEEISEFIEERGERRGIKSLILRDDVSPKG